MTRLTKWLVAGSALETRDWISDAPCLAESKIDPAARAGPSTASTVVRDVWPDIGVPLINRCFGDGPGCYGRANLQIILPAPVGGRPPSRDRRDLDLESVPRNIANLVPGCICVENSARPEDSMCPGFLTGKPLCTME